MKTGQQFFSLGWTEELVKSQMVLWYFLTLAEGGCVCRYSETVHTVIGGYLKHAFTY